MWDRVHPGAGPDLAAHQAETGAALSIDGNRRMHQQAVRIAPRLRRGRLFFTGPKPRRRCPVVGNFTSQVSSIASTCSPAQAAPVCVLLEAMIFAVVTFLLPKNQPAPSSPPRSPPSRLRHTVLRASICSRTAPPFYRGAHPRMSQVTSPWRLLAVRCRDTPKPIRPASGQSHSDSQITCGHALAPTEGGEEFVSC